MKQDDHDSLPAAVGESVLQAYLQGTVDFEAALAFQRRQVYQIAAAPHQVSLLLCEHERLISVGRQGSRSHILFEPEELRARQWRVRWVNRGGGCMLHVPGQLAIYSVLSLKHFQLGLHTYLEQFAGLLVKLLDDFSVPAETRPGHAGVWVAGRPIAALGVAVRDWVAYYGAVLNISPSLEPFRRVHCALPAEGPMTSLERERRGPLRPALVRERFIEHFASHFGLERTTLFFEDPSLSRKARSDAVATSS